VVTREHHRNEHARDLIIRVAAHASFISKAVENLKEIRVLLVALGSTRKYRLDVTSQLAPSSISGPQGRNRKIRIHIRQSVGASLKVHKDARIFRSEFVSKLRTDQARGRGIQRQLGKKVHQVDFAGVRPRGRRPLNFCSNLLSVTSHERIPETLIPHGLLALLWGRVENYTFPENGLHEGIRRGLIKLIVRRSKESFLRFDTRHQSNAMAGSIKDPKLTTLRSKPSHHGQRLATHLEEMPDQRPAPGESGGPLPFMLQLHCRLHVDLPGEG